MSVFVDTPTRGLLDLLEQLLTQTTVLTSGSQVVGSGDSILGEDGSPILGEDGSKITDESQTSTYTSDDVILSEDGGAVFGEDGGKISDESATLTLVPQQGAATPLLLVSTVVTRVTILAKVGNTDTIWVGGSTVMAGIGIPLSITSPRYDLTNKDLSEVFIIGIVGEGVTFNYEAETTTPTDSGEILGEDGDAILGEDGGKILEETTSGGVPETAILDSDGNPVLDSDGNYILRGEP